MVADSRLDVFEVLPQSRYPLFVADSVERQCRYGLGLDLRQAGSVRCQGDVQFPDGVGLWASEHLRE